MSDERGIDGKLIGNRGAPEGHFGNVPFEPTDKQRAEVTNYARAFCTQDQIADIMGISRATIKKYFAKEFAVGRSKSLARVSASVYAKAAAGDLLAAMFILKTQGGWAEARRVILTGEEGAAPIKYQDLSQLTDEELEQLERISNKLAPEGGDLGGEGEAGS